MLEGFFLIFKKLFYLFLKSRVAFTNFRNILYFPEKYSQCFSSLTFEITETPKLSLMRFVFLTHVKNLIAKGQLILKGHFKVFICTKNERKYFCISALASKKRSNKKIGALYTNNWWNIIWPRFIGYGRNTKIFSVILWWKWKLAS